jgi:pimeloyl-ACP methyl ester carboxylesterase
MMRSSRKSLFVLISFVGLLGCKKLPPSMIHLMPAPDIYADGAIDPLPETHPLEIIPYGGILFATDREPANEEGNHYRNDRGLLLRLGVASLSLGEGDYTWEEERRITLLKDREKDYPLSITSVEEFGFLEETYTPFLDPADIPDDWTIGGELFADAVNAKLAVSEKRDLFVYVHGFKTAFENPLLVSSELWHFLGYDGVFIAYSWPSTPSIWAYGSDLETTQLTARNLRLFLNFLARETKADRIHVIGFSAGTRVVLGALNQLSARPDPATLRIGNVILVGSDFDRQLFGAHILDGLLGLPETLTIYESGADQALRMSREVLNRNRLGQALEEMPDYARTFLSQTENIVAINVTEAEGSTDGNGHSYFRVSPWVSSDILMLLMYDLDPRERGLVRGEADGLWSFPPDYIERLRRTLETGGGSR